MQPTREAVQVDLEQYRVRAQPYYRAGGNEIALFEAAHDARMPVMLKGPTGCGKTRFVEFIAWRLGKPLVTIACNEDTSAGDLLGRWLLDAQGTRWQDGPLAVAARCGAICYLDEVVEARPDTLVAIHPLADARRMLPLDKRNELVRAHPDFQLVISFNPSCQASSKDLKASLRQRFAAIDFGYPPPEVEAEIVAREARIDAARAACLVRLGARTRRLRGHGLEEGASTRMLVQAGMLMARGVDVHAACTMAIVQPITDDADLRDALDAAVAASF